MYKYTIYDNDNEIIFSSDDKRELDIFMMINNSGSIYMFHKENDIFIMFFENYSIYIKEM